MPAAPSLASETARDRMSVRLRGLCEGPAGVCVCDRLYAFGFEALGVWVGVWLKGMYFCDPSMPAGLLLEWLCNVFEREGVCCVYCCAFVWICIVGTVFGAEKVEEGAGLPPAGWRAPGTLFAPAFEGITLGGCEF